MPIQAPTISEGEQVLDMGNNGAPGGAFVARVSDPNIVPQPYASPADFTAQYPNLLDPTEVIAMCEEITLWQAIPEEETGINTVTWRELNSLAFTSGSAAIAFADGECPSEYTHDGTNTTVTHKNIGAKKSLSQRDLKHSLTLAGLPMGAINSIVGGIPAGDGVPGGSDTGTFLQERIADVKEKEVVLQETLTLNGWDRLLAVGDVSGNSLEFDGIENLVTSGNGSHVNSAVPSGTFSAATYDRFLAESCAKPTHIFGHGQAIQEMLSGYFQLGFAGSQLVNFENGNRITPGFNFAGFVNTGVGRLAVVSDNNFTRTDLGDGTFFGRLFGLRMTHNGVPLVYKSTQIPLQMVDLVPGCTAISFEVWAATALIVKHKCAHSNATYVFTGRISTTCPTIG
jgi:hypothetical protein